MCCGVLWSPSQSCLLAAEALQPFTTVLVIRIRNPTTVRTVLARLQIRARVDTNRLVLLPQTSVVVSPVVGASWRLLGCTCPSPRDGSGASGCRVCTVTAGLTVALHAVVHQIDVEDAVARLRARAQENMHAAASTAAAIQARAALTSGAATGSVGGPRERPGRERMSTGGSSAAAGVGGSRGVRAAAAEAVAKVDDDVAALQQLLSMQFVTEAGARGVMVPSAAAVARVVAAVRLPLVGVEVSSNVSSEYREVPPPPGSPDVSSRRTPSPSSLLSRTGVVEAAVQAGRVILASVGVWIPMCVIFRRPSASASSSAAMVPVSPTTRARRSPRAHGLLLRVVGAQDISRHWASLEAGDSELEWLGDVMVDGWMQGGCVQVRAACVLPRLPRTLSRCVVDRALRI
jgi:hypothetical protein